jgi:hypothetical protein
MAAATASISSTPLAISSSSTDSAASAMAAVTISDYNQEHAGVEAWLDEHPKFFQDYLIRKGGRGMIDAWLVSHALPPGVNTTANTGNEEHNDAGATSSSGGEDGGGLRSAAGNAVNTHQGPHLQWNYMQHL